jgi:hypothetical protein
MEILEREMASQREALERLKQMGPRQEPLQYPTPSQPDSPAVPSRRGALSD